MNDYKKQVGLRLRQVREIMNEGSKLSAEQFAYLVNENGDKIRNYELGRANIPIRLLLNLYQRGINPNFIISGEGDKFLDNTEGKRLSKLISNHIKIDEIADGKVVEKTNEKSDESSDERINKTILKVAAGKINYDPNK